MPVYFFTDAGGAQCFVEAGRKPSYAEGRVPRMPGPFERWDAASKAFIYDAQGHADHIAGPAHIAAMHQRKAIEAALIADGVIAPAMLLVREAELRGVTPEELAETVRSKAAEAERIELARQSAGLS